MRPRQCVIQFFEPGLGKEVTAGKFVELKPGTFVYVNDVTLSWDLMEKLDAWGIAPCVVKAMERMGIKAIHFRCTDEGVTYATRLNKVKAFGVLRRFGRRGEHYHLPRKYWETFHGLYDYPWVTKVWKLEWLEPAKVDQMEMAL